MDDRELRGAAEQRCRDQRRDRHSRARCDIHHNGQIGIAGDGKDILIEGNRIWSNNIYGFDSDWEAGGVKIAEATASRSAAIMSMTTWSWPVVRYRLSQRRLRGQSRREQSGYRHLSRDFVQRGDPEERGAA